MKNGTSALIGIGIIAIFTIILFYVLKGFWVFASFFAWGFLLVAAIVNYKVVLEYARGIFDLLKRNPLYGIGAIGFSVLLYPLVFFILMMRALGGNVLKNSGFSIPGMPQNVEEESYSEYEEIVDEELELRELETKKREFRK